MGCDMHIHAEVKIGDVWHHVRGGVPTRNYKLFGALAGVRGGQPMFPVKGFPQDASGVTRLEYSRWGPDAHTPSYLESGEIGSLYLLWENDWGLGCYLEHAHGLQAPTLDVGYLCEGSWTGPFPEGVEDVRWVFRFDN